MTVSRLKPILLCALGALLIGACGGVPPSAATATPGSVAPTPGLASLPLPLTPTPTPEELAVAPDVATPTPPTRDPGVVMVYTSSSLADAFQEIASAFLTANHAATGVQFTLGSSTYLRTQLVDHAADADVFATSDGAQMDSVRQANRLSGPALLFARDHLILITPSANSKQIHALKDLATQGMRWVTTDPAEPTEQAALALLDRASADPAYGSDFRAKAERNILSRIGTTADVVDRVQRGEADAGIVSASDVPTVLRSQLQEIGLPDALNAEIDYSVAAVAGSNTAGGRAFATFLLSPRAQDILVTWGFLKTQNSSASSNSDSPQGPGPSPMPARSPSPATP